MKKWMILLLSLLLLPSLCYADFAKTGTVGAQFLKIGVGARAIGMAEAYEAVGEDATVIFWNPACLIRIENNSLFLAHTEWFEGVRYEAGAYARTFPAFGTIGFSFSYLTSGDIEETTVAQQEGTGNIFTTSNMMAGVSYARSLTDKLPSIISPFLIFLNKSINIEFLESYFSESVSSELIST